MKCTNCKDANLVMTDRNGIEIDYCPYKRKKGLLGELFDL